MFRTVSPRLPNEFDASEMLVFAVIFDRLLTTTLSAWSEASESLCDHLAVRAGERPGRVVRLLC